MTPGPARDVPTPDRSRPVEARLAVLEERVPADNLLRVSQVPIDLGAKLAALPSDLAVRLDRIEQAMKRQDKFLWGIVAALVVVLVEGFARWVGAHWH